LYERLQNFSQIIDSWVVKDADKDLVQSRIRQLVGIPDWIDGSMRIFDLTGSQKANTWLRLTMGPMAFLFLGIFHAQPNVEDTLYRLISCLHKCVVMTYDVLDREAEQARMDRFKLDVAETCSLFEVQLTFLSTITTNLLTIF
jgi:hypothetical protein